VKLEDINQLPNKHINLCPQTIITLSQKHAFNINLSIEHSGNPQFNNRSGKKDPFRKEVVIE